MARWHSFSLKLLGIIRHLLSVPISLIRIEADVGSSFSLLFPVGVVPVRLVPLLLLFSGDSVSLFKVQKRNPGLFVLTIKMPHIVLLTSRSLYLRQ